MILIQITQDGRAAVLNPQRIAQGTDSESIVLLSPFPARNPVLMGWVMPDQVPLTADDAPEGANGSYYPMVNVIPTPDFGVNADSILSVWTYKPTKAYTAQAGTANACFLVQQQKDDGNGGYQYENLTTNPVEIEITETIMPTLPQASDNTLLNDIYQAIVYYNNHLQDIDQKGVTTVMKPGKAPELDGNGAITNLTDVQRIYSVDEEPTDDSDNLVTSGGVKAALDRKQVLLLDPVPTDGSTNPVESNGVYDAIQTAKEDAEAAAKQYTDTAVAGLPQDFVTGVKGEAESSYRNGNVNITPANIGLGNVDNTSDLNKPISNATQTALNAKLAKKPDGTNDLINSNNKVNNEYLPDFILGQVVFGGTFAADTSVATLSSNAKGKLGTSDNTIVLTNDTTAVTGYVANEGIYYVTSVGGSFSGQQFVVGDWLISTGNSWAKIDNTDAVQSVAGKTGAVVLDKYDVGLGNVDNTSDGNKPVSTAQQAAIDAVAANGFAKVYRGIPSSLSSSATMDDLVAAMVNNSYLVASVVGYANLKPSSAETPGVLEVIKGSGSQHTVARYTVRSDDALVSSTPKKTLMWIGEFSNNGWKEWKVLAENDTINQENFIVNGDLSINTNGQASYNTSGAECVDRFTVGDATNIVVTPKASGGVTITGSGDQSTQTLLRYDISLETLRKLSGNWACLKVNLGTALSSDLYCQLTVKSTLVAQAQNYISNAGGNSGETSIEAAGEILAENQYIGAYEYAYITLLTTVSSGSFSYDIDEISLTLGADSFGYAKRPYEIEKYAVRDIHTTFPVANPSDKAFLTEKAVFDKIAAINPNTSVYKHISDINASFSSTTTPKDLVNAMGADGDISASTMYGTIVNNEIHTYTGILPDRASGIGGILSVTKRTDVGQEAYAFRYTERRRYNGEMTALSATVFRYFTSEYTAATLGGYAYYIDGMFNATADKVNKLLLGDAEKTNGTPEAITISSINASWIKGVVRGTDCLYFLGISSGKLCAAKLTESGVDWVLPDSGVAAYSANAYSLSVGTYNGEEYLYVADGSNNAVYAIASSDGMLSTAATLTYTNSLYSLTNAIYQNGHIFISTVETDGNTTYGYIYDVDIANATQTTVYSRVASTSRSPYFTLQNVSSGNYYFSDQGAYFKTDGTNDTTIFSLGGLTPKVYNQVGNFISYFNSENGYFGVKIIGDNDSISEFYFSADSLSQRSPSVQYLCDGGDGIVLVSACMYLFADNKAPVTEWIGAFDGAGLEYNHITLDGNFKWSLVAQADKVDSAIGDINTILSTITTGAGV